MNERNQTLSNNSQSPNISDTDNIKLIQSAFAAIENVSCIRFVPRTYQNDYVEIINGFTCASNVGRVGGRQTVSLSKDGGCMHRGLIIHEFLQYKKLIHAKSLVLMFYNSLIPLHSVLGFFHMHTSRDRDNFIKVNYHNLRPDRFHNFEIQPNYDRYGTPYDYNSILHYGGYSFSKNGHPTIQPLDTSVSIHTLGQRQGMSEGDIMRLRRLYEC